MKKRILSLVICIVLFALSVHPVYSFNGSVSGTTYASSICGDVVGNKIPGLDVTLQDSSNQILQVIQSDSNGFYIFSGLLLDEQYTLVNKLLDGGSDSFRHTQFMLTMSNPTQVLNLNAISCTFSNSLFLPVISK